MSVHTQPEAAQTYPRVRLVAQPLSLGIILLAVGGWFGYHMLAAYTLSDPVWMQLANLALIGAFAALFLWGVRNLLSLFQQVRIWPGHVQLQMLGLTLLTIPEENIQSIRSLSRETTIRNKEVEYYRIYLHTRGMKCKKVWIDWSVAKEETLRENLPNTLFLM